MKKYDQAFPVGYNGHEGMTLRDYFAAQAMQGLLANGWCTSLRNDHYGEEAGNSTVAIDAYMMADAMLKARAP
jgi:hypothetical protein